MATSKKHYFQKPNVDAQAWPVDVNGNVTINAESMVWYDLGSNTLRELTDANSARFIGQCRDQVPVAIYSSTAFQMGAGTIPPNYPDNTAMVNRYGQAKMKATASQNYSPGVSVYIGADAQTVSTSGTAIIGYVSGEQPAVTNATAGQLILVDFRGNFPAVPVN
jgi:hypothetical protein